MKVEIWSDIVCPWCYIGRRRFENALSQFEHRDEVEIVWRSFQLDPTAPREYNGSINEMLAEHKGIHPRQAEKMHAHVTALAAEEGLQYHFDRARPGNSFDAHRLLHLAKHHDLQSEMKERLQKSYFTDGLSFSDPEMLVQLAAEVGLDADKTREMLLSDIFTAEVHGDIHRARMLGINGVPFFLFDQKYAVSGAQPTELFMTALQRSWADSQPVVKTLNMGENADMSDNENCVV